MSGSTRVSRRNDNAFRTGEAKTVEDKIWSFTIWLHQRQTSLLTKELISHSVTPNPTNVSLLTLRAMGRALTRQSGQRLQHWCLSFSTTSMFSRCNLDVQSIFLYKDLHAHGGSTSPGNCQLNSIRTISVFSEQAGSGIKTQCKSPAWCPAPDYMPHHVQVSKHVAHPRPR